MAFTITHLSGEMTPGIFAEIPGLLSELGKADSEHTDVSVQHESGLSLTVFPSGHVVLENVESDDPPQSAVVPLGSAALLELIEAVSQGHVGEVAGIDWREGYGRPESL